MDFIEVIFIIFYYLALMAIIFGSTIIVSILIANYFRLTGIAWWAVVIVVFLILNSLINGFRD